MESPPPDRMADKLLFQGLSRPQLEQVAEIVRVREVDAGDVIVSERDYGDTLYVIDEGRVEVRVASPDGDLRVATLRAPAPGEISYAGDFFGEMCLLDLEPRCASVIASEPCTLWELNRDDLYWLFGDDKELQLRILLTVARVLSRRLGMMDAAAATGTTGG
ncbi:MAG: cyclic nucleotide-binding domain-containing protein [Planctomycetota bacterium]